MTDLKKIIENIENKNFDEALKLCALYENKKNKHIILNFKGVINHRKNDLEKAEIDFLNSSKIDKNFADPIKNLYLIYLKKGSIKNLLSSAKKLVEIDKSNNLYIYQLAYAFEANNKLDEAINYYKIYLSSNGVNKKAALNNIGAIYLKKNQPRISLNYLLEAINLGEDKIIINNTLNCFIKLRDSKNADLYYDKAKDIDENFEEFIYNKAEYLIFKNKIDDALEILKTHKDKPKFFITLLNLYFNLGQNYEGYKLIDLSKDKIEKNPEFFRYYGFWSLTRGDFDIGWKYYEYRNSKKLNYFNGVKEWSGENIQKKSIVVFNEQGLGDSIQFSKYIYPLIKIANHVTFVVQENIKNIFTDKIENLSVENMENCKYKKYDFKIALGSLIKFFYKKKFKPNESIINYDLDFKLEEKIHSQKLNVGFSWSGSFNGPNEPYRSIPLKSLQNVFSLDANFYCLQNKIRESDLDVFDSLNLIDYGKYRLDELASIIKKLDLIIAVDTSILHLSAEFKKETWALFTLYPDWRWGDFNKFNPYSNLKIFKQNVFNDWTNVETLLVNELNKKILKFNKSIIS